MAIFTKRHYEVIAVAIREVRERALDPGSELHTYTLLAITRRFINAFEADNPKFDANKFMKACMPNKNQAR